MNMTILWIPLPIAWKLEDVQATLNVIVAALSAFSIFVFARVCWQAATAQIAKNRHVPLPALLSVNTVGEVYDILQLLGFNIFSSIYVRILLQCVVVSLLTTTAIFSGPIARFSTSRGTRISVRSVPGLLANRLNSGISHEQVLWNQTESSLDQAGFPYDQLPDFVPDPNVPWKYQKNEWNSSWTMQCDYTNSTAVKLLVEDQNCTSTSTLGMEIPDLMNVFNETSFDWIKSNWESETNGNNTIVKDALVFQVGWVYSECSNSTGFCNSINVTIVALHLQNLTESDPDSYCNFGKGPVEAASYTKAACAIQRSHPFKNNDTISGAYPDHASTQFLPLGYTSYFESRFDRAVSQDITPAPISPYELVRFYQVYQATQATRKPWPVTRVLDVEIPIVRVSTFFVVVCACFALMCIIGVARFGVFSVKNFDAVGGTPESKLDWMLQSIGARNSSTSYLLEPVTSRHSVVSMRSPDLASPGKRRYRRSEFESSVYGLHQNQQNNAPYHSNWVSSQSLGSRMSYGYSPVTEFPEFMENDAHNLSKWPTATSGRAHDDYNVERLSPATPLYDDYNTQQRSPSHPAYGDYNTQRGPSGYFGG